MKQRQSSRLGKGVLGWDVLLFFALYMIMPSYFAIEISSKLPLFTASRILFIIMGAMLLVRRRRQLVPLKLSQWNFLLTEDRWLRGGLFLYFVLLTVCNGVLLLTDTGEALKALFSVIVESYGLIWMLSLILDTREKLEKALAVAVVSSGVVATVVTVGCVLDVNPFYWLNTVEREMLMAGYYRLGLLRAEAGFGHPVYYGAFCAIMIPINMYFIENNENRNKHLLFSGSLGMNLVGLVLSNSRGSLCVFGCLAFLVLVIRIREKRFGELCKIYLPIVGIALMILGVVALMSPAGLAFLRGIVASLINTVAPGSVSMDIIIDENTVISYGKNASGGRSRMTQMTGMLWTMKESPLFGLGSNAHKRGLVFYQNKQGIWSQAQTFDVALVSIVCQYGLVGLAGYISLFGSIFRTTAIKVYRQDSLMHFLGLAFITYLLCLITISSLDKVAWMLITVIVCLCNIIRKESSCETTH